MKILIIEDELLAQEELVRLLKISYPSFEIVNIFDSVKKSAGWLARNKVDLIFMDIHLSDGSCFDIFDITPVHTPIIFTTAYDQYAIRAFQVNGIGYILKPIMEDDLKRAIEKLEMTHPVSIPKRVIHDILQSFPQSCNYKNRISIRTGDRYSFKEIMEIAYFYTEDKVSFLMTKEGKRHMINYNLDTLQPLLDPARFFRITRNCIACIDAINIISRHFNSRLKITLNPEFNGELLISRIRVPDFLKWIDGDY